MTFDPWPLQLFQLWPVWADNTMPWLRTAGGQKIHGLELEQ